MLLCLLCHPRKPMPSMPIQTSSALSLVMLTRRRIFCIRLMTRWRFDSLTSREKKQDGKRQSLCDIKTSNYTKPNQFVAERK